ncbi:MAG: translation initiation factor IF-6 [Candidatus Norongarragalinales archaeon]
MRIEKTSFYNNPFAGLFIKTNDAVTLLPKNAPDKLERQVENVLQTKPLRLYVDQSPLLGVFSAMNNNGCVLQDSAEKHEQNLIKKEGLNVHLLKGHSPGNNILANSKACLLNPEIPEKEARKIGDCLGVEVVRQKVGIKTVGATNVVTGKGILAYNETSEVELKYLEKTFGVKGLVGTSNFGQVYNGFSIIANDKGALVGNATTGVEIQRIFEALGG